MPGLRQGAHIRHELLSPRTGCDGTKGFKSRGGKSGRSMVGWEVTEACARDRKGDVTQNSVETFYSCMHTFCFRNIPDGSFKAFMRGRPPHFCSPCCLPDIVSHCFKCSSAR
ncbi:unnamed protein product [Ectocarpus sp. 12 AP-2014]